MGVEFLRRDWVPHYPVEPDELTSIAERISSMVKFLGGRCGTTPKHFVAVHDQLPGLLS